ncbi:carboxylesterase family protein [Mangrovibacterium lignilyticum]|uniref:carboxylesterase family protein n=1 Tax=Mangrovibacterium lignilyticum TaxID=2668052 RepID=UPI0013D8B030|nr:carboxylesterase family protein [Mangrovibacterium lignilyticum]
MKVLIRVFVLFLLLSIGVGTVWASDGVKKASPDKKIEVWVSVTPEGRLSYNAKSNGIQVLETSPLGIVVDGLDLGDGAKIVSKPVRTKIDEAYPAGESSVPKTAHDLMRDAAFGWQTWSLARLQSETGRSKVFYYYFDQHPDYPEDSPMFGHGSPNGQDVVYVCQHLDASNPQTSESYLEISEAMGTYWTNFAKYGDPNGEGVPEWPSFSAEDPQVMYLGPKPHVGPVPSSESLQVLDSYFSWRRTTEGADWAE